MKYGDAAAVLSATTTTRTTAMHSELIKLEQRERKANSRKNLITKHYSYYLAGGSIENVKQNTIYTHTLDWPPGYPPLLLLPLNSLVIPNRTVMQNVQAKTEPKCIRRTNHK